VLKRKIFKEENSAYLYRKGAETLKTETKEVRSCTEMVRIRNFENGQNRCIDYGYLNKKVWASESS